jgi:hypothetical protein
LLHRLGPPHFGEQLVMRENLSRVCHEQA